MKSHETSDPTRRSRHVAIGTAPLTVKQCSICGMQAKCIDSRPFESRIRRRYACAHCPQQRWTTIEVLVDEVVPMSVASRDAIKHATSQLMLLAGTLRRLIE